MATGRLAKATAVVGLALAAVVVGAWLDSWLARARHRRAGLAHQAVAVERLADVPRALRESSGLAVSRRHPGVFWSHNDSGNGPTLYAFDGAGRLRATVALDGARAEDWEDMAIGPCPMPFGAPVDASCLFVADTGNNELTRSILTIWVVLEPASVDGRSRASSRGVRFRFPGPNEDSEAMAVTPGGDIVLVSKGRTGSIELFRLSADDIRLGLTTSEVLTARRNGDTGIEPGWRVGRVATGAAFSPDARMLAVRTYNEVFFFTDDERTGWRRVGPSCFLPLDESVGEAIAYEDERTLLLTSESMGRRPGALHRVRCPEAAPSGQ